MTPIAATRLAFGVLVTLALAPAAATAHSGHLGPVPINLRGNPFENNLRIEPTTVPGMSAGEYARFINGDNFVRHTAAEDHGVWAVGGAGLEPGAEEQRLFEAGTHRFHCAIHPTMRGEFAIPVQLYTDRRPPPKRKKGQKKPPVKYDVILIWSYEDKPAPDLVFDVERRRRDTGTWGRFKSGTSAVSGSFATSKRRSVWEIRARVRKRADESAATDWSPVASVRIP